MAFTSQEIEILKKAKQAGKTKEQALAELALSRRSVSPTNNVQAEDGASFMSRLNPFSRQNKERIADIPSDVQETFGGMVDQVSEGITGAQEARQRNQAGETSRFEAASEIIGGGLGAGAGVVGEGLVGVGKLFTTPEEEEKVKDLVQTATEAAAGTRPVQEIKQKYDSLSNQEQRNVQSFLGAVEGVGTMFGARPVFDAFRKALSTTGEGVGSVVRTSEQAARDVLDGVSDTTTRTESIAQPTTDIVRGVGQQIGDFAQRTARGARETAEDTRRLSNLPEPERGIRRVAADERVVDVIQRAPEAEHSIYKELVEQAKQKEQFPETSSVMQPKTIAGRELLKPVQHVIDQRKSVGNKLGEVRKKLNNEKNINTNSAFRNFHSYLRDNYNVKFNDQGKIIAGSGTIARSDVPVVQELYNELRKGTFMSQKEIDEFLQRSLKDFDLRQAREKTFSDEVSRIAERARTDMRQLMPEEYNALATQYAQLSKPLQDMVKLLQYKGDLDNLTAKELKASEVALRVLGNAADRPQSVIDGILDAARQTGYDSNVDLNRIIYITDQLEDLYDITPSRGFSGSTARGVEQGGMGVVSDAATLNVGGIFNQAMSSRASRDEVREAFEAYIDSL